MSPLAGAVPDDGTDKVPLPRNETMSTNEHESCEDRMADLMSRFSAGLMLLMALAERNAATGSREEVLEIFADFEAAY